MKINSMGFPVKGFRNMAKNGAEMKAGPIRTEEQGTVKGGSFSEILIGSKFRDFPQEGN
jgi:hypothetical protein